jgi:hypothetical protein
MEPVEYPRWLHHRTLEPVIARNANEGEMMLASGWALQPSAFVGCEPEEGAPITAPIVELIPKKKGGRPRKVS